MTLWKNDRRYGSEFYTNIHLTICKRFSDQPTTANGIVLINVLCMSSKILHVKWQWYLCWNQSENDTLVIGIFIKNIKEIEKKKKIHCLTYCHLW